MMTETVVTVAPQPAPQPAEPPKNPNNLGWLKINISYFATIPGILKLVQVVS